MDVPFPFPYAQAAMMLTFVFYLTSPFVLALWTGHYISAFLLTFISNACFLGVQFVSDDLHMPFGTSPNSLPCLMLHLELNEALVLLVSPLVQQAPRLSHA